VLTQVPYHEDVSGSEVVAPLVPNLSAGWRWGLNLTPRPLYPWGKSPGTYWMGGCVAPIASLDVVAKRKIPTPVGNPTPVALSISQSVYW